jgi:hypothetical protein
MDQISRVIATQLQNDKMVTIWPPKVASAKIDTATFK